MNTIFSIGKPFTDLIFDGTKSLEFRNQIGKNLSIGDTIYIYETKRNHGVGMVIGTVRVKNIIKLEFHKVGTYIMLPYYVNKYGTEKENAVIQRAMNIKLEHYDMSVILNYLYDENVLNYMEKHHDLPDTWTWELNQLPGCIHGYSYSEYNRRHDQSDKLCKDCDEWLTKIGYYSDDGASYWNYAIELESPIKFDILKDISEFVEKNGKKISRAPQSWCYVI